nr:RagB/SusD family nutrient uptake outer membrane protein [Chitinophagaceae bacterium]
MNMLYRFFIIITAAATFSGCAKLTEEPVGILSPTGFFKTPKDVQTAVFGGYGMLASELLYGRQFYFMLMYRGDMVDIGDRGTVIDRIQLNDFNMDANNAMVRLSWSAWYRLISAVNTAEAGAKDVTAPESILNPLIAEARFLRAFAYYHLVQCFGDIPYIDKPITDPQNSNTITKTKAADVWVAIIN